MTLCRTTSFQITLVCLMIAACTLPFAGKAFHVDDPLFIWTGMNILQNPLDFYGFQVNWYGSLQPMAVVTKNPPLFSYYLALAGMLAGWSEPVLHLACLVPALATGIGTYLLAREFSAEPLPATLAALLTPVFLLSATTVMCDVLLTAFWVWAIFLWLRAFSATIDARLLAAAAFLAGLAGLTKYYGVSLIPLFALYGLSTRTPLRRWLPFLLLPVAMLACYQLWTMKLYGAGLLSDAVGYSARTRNLAPGGMVAAIVTGLSYTGGGVLTALVFAPMLWGRRALFAIMLLLAVAALIISIPADINGYRLGFTEGRWLQAGQLLFFVAAGMGILAASVEDLYRLRDGRSLLLAAWIIGTFLFASCFNWTVSGRNILPLAPAVGILLVRRTVLFNVPWSGGRFAGPVAALLCSLLVSLGVVSADAAIANGARSAAGRLAGSHGTGAATIHFQGHWGFQYYMEKYGARAVDFKKAAFADRDFMVIPSYGTNVRMTTTEGFSAVETVVPAAPGHFSTMDANLGAGFYASRMAALPYAIGPATPVKYEVFLFTPGASAIPAR